MTSLRTNASIASVLAALLIGTVALQAQASGQEQAAASPKVLRKSSGALLNSVISRISPVYPAWAGYTAPSTVVIKVLVDEDGAAISAGLVSGDRLFGWSAIEALRQWRWQPSVIDGAPVKVLGLLSFTFTPDGSVSDGTAEPMAGAARPTDADLLSDYAIVMFKQESRESRLFEQAAEAAIRITDSNEQPLFVEQARVRTVKPEPPQPGSEDSYSLTNGSLMRAILVLRNTTGTPVTSAGIRFTNSKSRNSFLVRPWWVKHDPDRYAEIISQMLIPGDPSDFEVEVESVAFESGAVWTKPFPAASLYAGAPHGPAPAPASAPNPAGAPGLPPAAAASPRQSPVPSPVASPTALPVPAIVVDSRPVALNSPRPNYTETARRNTVSGTCRLRLLVGSDGEVKRITVLSPLPDFLTEEAIKAGYQIKFKPAMKDGQPVAFWQSIDVDFNLR